MFGKKSKIRRYGGTLIHNELDDEGLIEVVDVEDRRYLHFGTSAKQSGFLPDHPDYLLLEYCRAMVMGLAFKKKIDKTLFLGVGGGSILRFVSTYFPYTNITAVELRRAVLISAKRYFKLPVTKNTRYIIGNAADFLEVNREKFDVVFIDLYDSHGMVSPVYEEKFLRNVKDSLNKDGMAVFNVWSQITRSSSNFMENIKLIFGGYYHFATSSGNVILYVFENYKPFLISMSFKDQINFLEKKTSLRVRNQLTRIKNENSLPALV